MRRSVGKNFGEKQRKCFCSAEFAKLFPVVVYASNLLWEKFRALVMFASFFRACASLMGSSTRWMPSSLSGNGDCSEVNNKNAQRKSRKVLSKQQLNAKILHEAIVTSTTHLVVRLQVLSIHVISRKLGSMWNEYTTIVVLYYFAPCLRKSLFPNPGTLCLREGMCEQRAIVDSERKRGIGGLA